MAYWLLKTEPENYSYFDLEQDVTTVWDGVNNALAQKYLRMMVPGDSALIYHTGKEREVIGLAEIISYPYTDPKLDDAKRVVVDVKAVRKISGRLTLSKIKDSGRFNNWELLRLPRLSVVPICEQHWQCLRELTEVKTTGN